MLAAGTASALEQVEEYFTEESRSRNTSKYSEQPKNIQEGLRLGYGSLNEGLKQAQRSINQDNSVPLAMIRPVIGLADAFAKTLIGIQNSLDLTQQKRMEEKYKK